MIDLNSIKRSSERQLPPRIVLYAPHGVGKTTFAANAPSPIFIQAEDGLAGVEVDSFPLVESFNDVLAAVKTLQDEDHDFKTLVVDSIDWVEPHLWAYLAAEHNQPDIEAFGYGKGYTLAADKWRTLLAGFNDLRKTKGMAIILLAHAQVKRFDSPEVEPFDRYEIKLHKHASALVQEWCDCLLFANFKTMTTSTDTGFGQKKTRGIGTGERIMHTAEKPAFLAKNRYSLPATLPFAWPEFQNALIGDQKNG